MISPGLFYLFVRCMGHIVKDKLSGISFLYPGPQTGIGDNWWVFKYGIKTRGGVGVI